MFPLLTTGGRPTRDPFVKKYKAGRPLASNASRTQNIDQNSNISSLVPAIVASSGNQISWSALYDSRLTTVLAPLSTLDMDSKEIKNK